MSSYKSNPKGSLSGILAPTSASTAPFRCGKRRVGAVFRAKDGPARNAGANSPESGVMNIKRFIQNPAPIEET